MKVNFVKYHGTGNDFILIDDRRGTIKKKLTTKIIKALCTRRFGIGADGMILLKAHRKYDFEMIYYNADGRTSSMCGNGGRCIVHFAHQLKMFKKACNFLAIDGMHEAKVENNLIHLKMSDVILPKKVKKDFFIDTGSPHHIHFVKDVSNMNIVQSGQKIRYSSAYEKEGVNVNFVEKSARGISVRTYERGVEDETYSCGTGVTAAAITSHFSGITHLKSVQVQTLGGKLKVKFKQAADGYKDIWLIGPANWVNTGVFKL